MPYSCPLSAQATHRLVVDNTDQVVVGVRPGAVRMPRHVAPRGPARGGRRRHRRRRRVTSEREAGPAHRSTRRRSSLQSRICNLPCFDLPHDAVTVHARLCEMAGFCCSEPENFDVYV